MKKLLIIKHLIIVLIFLFTNSCITVMERQEMSSHNSLNETINKIRPCVVQVVALITEIQDISGQTKGFPPFRKVVVGTGFLINEESYVVTNAHVIRDTMKEFDKIQARKKEILIGFAIPDSHDSNIELHGNFIVTPFNIIAIDETNDIAILKTLMNPFTEKIGPLVKVGEKNVGMVKVSFCKLYKDIPTEGTKIAVSGYPLEIPTLISHHGIISSAIFPFKQSIDSFYVDARVNHGNSGGPTYLAETGEVIGIASAYRLAPIEKQDYTGKTITTHELLQNSGLTQIIPIKKVIELLEKNNITWH